ncbi:hypothetical protein AB0O42_26030 [Streptomyces sp. NPDC089922]|uniref:hypothetical protein n=1 Tax=Streptomyces sp. NPDC089922 TaxID=3155189 RepID=UPI00343C2C94
MPTAQEDRTSRRLAWCVAHLLRHAPDHVVIDMIHRLDEPTLKYLCRDEWLSAPTVTLLLRHGAAADRGFIARNPRVVGRPLPGLPGPARYAARPGPGREPAEAAGPGPLGRDALLALLRRHGRRPRTPLTLLRLPHDPPDPGALLREHARDPLPPGAVEALLLVGGLPLETSLALLDTRGRTGGDIPASWHRPPVRAVRMGLATFEEVVAHLAPAHLTLRLADHPATGGLRWSLPEQAGMRTALTRALRPLGDSPRHWAALEHHVPGFRGTLPELVAAIVSGDRTPPAPDAEQTGPAAGPAPDPLAHVLGLLRPGPPPEHPEPRGDWEPGQFSAERGLALVSLAVPMDSVQEDIRWIRDCLSRGLLTGADVVRYKVPACWALDEDHWLGDGDGPDRHDWPAPVLAAHAETARLTAPLGDDPEAWWRAARALPDFTGTVPELCAAAGAGGPAPREPSAP